MAGPKNNLQDVLAKRNASNSVAPASPAPSGSQAGLKKAKFRPAAASTPVTSVSARKATPTTLPSFSTSGFGRNRPPVVQSASRSKIDVISISSNDSTPATSYRPHKRASSDPSLTSDPSPSFKRPKTVPSKDKENVRPSSQANAKGKGRADPYADYSMQDVSYDDDPWKSTTSDAGQASWPIALKDRPQPPISVLAVAPASPHSLYPDLQSKSTEVLKTILISNLEAQSSLKDTIIQYHFGNQKDMDIVILEEIKNRYDARIAAIKEAISTRENPPIAAPSVPVIAPASSSSYVRTPPPSNEAAKYMTFSRQDSATTELVSTQIVAANNQEGMATVSHSNVSTDVVSYPPDSLSDSDEAYAEEDLQADLDSDSMWQDVGSFPLDGFDDPVDDVDTPHPQPVAPQPIAPAALTKPPDPNLSNSSYYPEIMRILREVFSLQAFRMNQLEAIVATMDRRDVFVLMPTGGGKSLCYQLPACCTTGETRGVTFIVSPLLALMQDQVRALKSKGVDVLQWNSESTPQDVQHINERLRSHRKPSMVYITPEKLKESTHLKSILTRLYLAKELARFVVDEAHCISSWGRDFRDAYQELHILRDDYPEVPIMALTASANRTDVRNIQNRLRMRDPLELIQSFNRPNLRYTVMAKPVKSKLLDQVTDLIRNKYHRKTGIIYCLSRRTCEEFAQSLQQKGINAKHYHAGMSAQDKAATSAAWQSGACSVIVATIAFGMGIDKPDVRYVIHHSIPKSMEGYYQETGRAGRDGEPADCLMYYMYGDAKTLINMITSTRDEGQRDRLTPADIDRQTQAINGVARFCNNNINCRREQILAYFGEQFDPKDCQKSCDNCKEVGVVTMVDYSQEAIAIVQLVQTCYERGEKLTSTQCVNALRGSKAKDVRDRGLDKLPSYGAGHSMPPGMLERLCDHLLIEDVLSKYTHDNAGGWAHDYLMPSKHADAVIEGLKTVKLGYRSDTKILVAKPKRQVGTRSIEQYTSPTKRKKPASVQINDTDDIDPYLDDEPATPIIPEERDEIIESSSPKVTQAFPSSSRKKIAPEPSLEIIGDSRAERLHLKFRVLRNEIMKREHVQAEDVFDDEILEILSLTCPSDYVAFKAEIRTVYSGSIADQAELNAFVEERFNKYGQQFLNICMRETMGEASAPPMNKPPPLNAGDLHQRFDFHEEPASAAKPPFKRTFNFKKIS